MSLRRACALWAATVGAVCRANVSHRLSVDGQVQGGAAPLVITVLVIPPEGLISEATYNTSSGQVDMGLVAYDGGRAEIRVLLRDALGRESAAVETVQVAAVPQFDVQPDALTFTIERGQPVEPQIVSIRDARGASFVGWEAAAEAPWIRPRQAAGTTPSELAVSVSPVSVPRGLHTSAIVVRDDASAGCRVPVAVSVAKAYHDVFLPSLRRSTR